MHTCGQLATYKVLTKVLNYPNVMDFCQLHLAKLRTWEALAIQC
jgi:hypothetical protein